MGFFQTCNSIFDVGLTSLKLTPLEYTVYSYLLRLSNKAGQSFPSYRAIMDKCNIGSKSTVKKALNGLVACELLSIENRVNAKSGSWTSNLYTILPSISRSAERGTENVPSTNINSLLGTEIEPQSTKTVPLPSTDNRLPLSNNCTAPVQNLDYPCTETVHNKDTHIKTYLQRHIEENPHMGKSGEAAPDMLPIYFEHKTDHEKDPKSGITEKAHQAERFATFWEQYPRKGGKMAAQSAWNVLNPDTTLFEAIMSGLAIAKYCDQWNRDNGRYIPNPVRWLNERRWEDIPLPAKSTQSSNPFFKIAQELDDEEQNNIIEVSYDT